jgi:cell division protein ZapA
LSNVTLTIAGRAHTVACTPGEEAHIAMLGASIDAKLATLPRLAGQTDARVLLYAALLLADEVHEAERVAAQNEDDMANLLETFADRLESLASQLEQQPTNA